MKSGKIEPPLQRRTSPETETPVEEDYQVMSEVHLGCPPYISGPFISYFTISLPSEVELMGRKNDVVSEGELSSSQQVISLDEDGDLVLTRRRKDSKYKFVMAIQHNITSSIPSVGLQVWRAELVLADYVMHKMSISSDFDGIIAAELGAGTGGSNTVFTRVGGYVACACCHNGLSNRLCCSMPDHGDEVLDNCVTNVRLNYGKFSASIYVRELDWKVSWPPPLEKSSTSEKRYGWTSHELEELQRASFLVAADVIYSDDLTDAFFYLLEKLMSQCPNKVLYMALEKRYNFTLDDLGVVANGYSHFRSYLRDEKINGAYQDDHQNDSSSYFIGTCINLTEIPQYVREYDRGDDVEIWQIKYRRQP